MSPEGRRLPPPLPGEEAAARRAENPIPGPGDSEPRQDRKALKAVLIGIAATAIGAVVIPILIVVVLGIVAQIIISGH